MRRKNWPKRSVVSFEGEEEKGAGSMLCRFSDAGGEGTF